MRRYFGMLQKRMVYSLILAATLMVYFLPHQASAVETVKPMEADVSEGAIVWPGSNQVDYFDNETFFLRNTSGLDFYDEKLFVVDNGNGRIWILDVAADGSMTPTEGFETGKRVQYADRKSSKGPDAEGITVCEKGYVYLAAERDNSALGVACNMILQVDPWNRETPIRALQEWDLTDSLPKAYVNEGLEAAEWVSGQEMTGKLVDQNTGKLFDIADYPDAVSGGIFFLVLETTDCIYAYILNQDGTAVRIAEIDPCLPGAVALDYDPASGALWVAADDRGANKMAKLHFLEGKYKVTHIFPPDGIDPDQNYEGFAIAEENYVAGDRRPVYHIRDGVFSKALAIGSMDYHVHDFSDEWIQSEMAHWNACACGEQENTEEHIFGNVISEETKKSDLCRNQTAAYYQSCLICGYVDAESTFYDGRALCPEKFTTPVAAWIYGEPNM